MINEMWNGFSDYELAHLASQYGLETSLVFADNLNLANRAEVECLLTEAEYSIAFPVDFNCNMVYNNGIEIEETI